ncbi:RNA-binding protein 42-like [Diaphorina citri]|uniref:RNA-binding protein 42 n=1 Tax=Diaphorina citri TaxID=121845 RepID=A0A3Q0IYS7_DIACI|nr:RNA-binding protein 42-like [Diaphorina citri]
MEKNQKPMSKKKAKEMADAVAASIVTQTVVQSGPSNPGQSNSQQNPGGQNLKKKDKNNKAKKIRTAGGVAWEDPTLAEWEDDDFRLFCGDLGNDVTDELLIRTFSKYPSFLKAKVVRDKRTNKTKGFGFVSFKDPQDFIRANKEMNGKFEDFFFYLPYICTYYRGKYIFFFFTCYFRVPSPFCWGFKNQVLNYLERLSAL